MATPRADSVRLSGDPVWDFALISGSLGASKSVYGPAIIAPLALVVVGIVVFRRRHRIEPEAPQGEARRHE